LICGLKELPESNEPLVHNHVYFAHCYKGQAGGTLLISIFSKALFFFRSESHL
jgi:saccharopine dehydrogenase (NAD+, L-lysine-forming)